VGHRGWGFQNRGLVMDMDSKEELLLELHTSIGGFYSWILGIQISTSPDHVLHNNTESEDVDITSLSVSFPYVLCMLFELCMLCELCSGFPVLCSACKICEAAPSGTVGFVGPRVPYCL
jgi:hypothetical protein